MLPLAHRSLVLSTLMILRFTIPSAADSNSGAGTASEQPFDWITGLVGDWEGTTRLVGDDSQELPARASYYLTGEGSAVVENLDLGGHSMTSVYYLENDTLRMTHFCAAGNQPRLKQIGAAGDRQGEPRSVKLELVDITNLSSPDAFHVADYEIHPDGDRLVLLITARVKRVDRLERVELVRVSESSPLL